MRVRELIKYLEQLDSNLQVSFNFIGQNESTIEPLEFSDLEETLNQLLIEVYIP